MIMRYHHGQHKINEHDLIKTKIGGVQPFCQVIMNPKPSSMLWIWWLQNITNFDTKLCDASVIENCFPWWYLEHEQKCSVCDPAKIFFTSKFSYLLFCNPPLKLKLRQQIHSGLLIPNLGQSETLSRNYVCHCWAPFHLTH
jgi:hypothetical protein